MYKFATVTFVLAISLIASVAVTTARADVIPPSGISYSYVVGPASGYSDPGCTKLTDGVSGSDAYSSGQYAAWWSESDAPVDAVATFNLGQAYNLSEIAVGYLVNASSIITGFDSWTVTLSNNSDMSSPVYSNTFSPLSSSAGWYTANGYDDPTHDGVACRRFGYDRSDAGSAICRGHWGSVPDVAGWSACAGMGIH